MRQSEVIALIEKTAPLELAAEWDHSGLQVASARKEITHLAVCLDPVPDAIEKALERGADMILSHHPLQMSPGFLDVLDGFHQSVSLLFRADVPLYSAHTSLDANPFGPVAWLADELGLTEKKTLEPSGPPSRREAGYGIGIKGTLPADMTPEQFVENLRPWVKKGHVSLAGPDLPKTIRDIAICPGSGGSLLEKAAKAGAQLMITGDVKYHIALESPISVIDVGHFLLEEEMMRRFAVSLSTSLQVSFIPSRDPVRPLPFTS